jgi:hypothetical protein
MIAASARYMRPVERFSRDDRPVRNLAADAGPELLPWADPYIAELHRQNAQELRREQVAEYGVAAAKSPARRVAARPRFRPEYPRRERMNQSRTLSVLS